MGRAAYAALVVVIALLTSGCGFSGFDRLIVDDPARTPPDAIVVLGCPSDEDGSLSECQKGRAAQAALAWSRGYAKHFIVTGGAVHTPFSESDAIAAGMEAMGVPAESIYLEGEALHTDENVFFSMRLAERLGFSKVGVLSSGGHEVSRFARGVGLSRLAWMSSAGHALWACHMMSRWGEPCGAIAIDVGDLEQFLAPHRARLERVWTPKVADWAHYSERERQRREHTGRGRPPSFLLYAGMALGSSWKPHEPKLVAPVTWAQRRTSHRDRAVAKAHDREGAD